MSFCTNTDRSVACLLSTTKHYLCWSDALFARRKNRFFLILRSAIMNGAWHSKVTESRYQRPSLISMSVKYMTRQHSCGCGAILTYLFPLLLGVAWSKMLSERVRRWTASLSVRPSSSSAHPVSHFTRPDSHSAHFSHILTDLTYLLTDMFTVDGLR